jgi:Flp pilus assembly protein TadG
MSRFRSDRGATAVEFAFVLVPLMLILLGVVDFGRVYNQQLTLTAAARAGVRVMAVLNDTNAAYSATKAAAPGLSPALADAQISFSTTCVPLQSPPQTVTITITYPTSSLTGMFNSILQGKVLKGVGAMRCGG